MRSISAATNNSANFSSSSSSNNSNKNCNSSESCGARSEILQQDGHPMQKDTTLTKIFVGGLPYHTTDESLRHFFECFGPIEEAVVITDRQSGKSRGYGFVTMTNVADACRAISNPNPCIDGRKANVNLAVLGAKPRILPGAGLNAMTLSHLVPLQSLVPQPGGSFYGAGPAGLMNGNLSMQMATAAAAMMNRPAHSYIQAPPLLQYPPTSTAPIGIQQPQLKPPAQYDYGAPFFMA